MALPAVNDPTITNEISMSVLDPIEDGDDAPNVLQRIQRTPESSMDGLTPAVPDSQATVPWGPADENARADRPLPFHPADSDTAPPAPAASTGNRCRHPHSSPGYAV